MTALIGAGMALRPRELIPDGAASELLQVIDEESDRLNRFIEGLSAPIGRTRRSRPPARRQTLEHDRPRRR